MTAAVLITYGTFSPRHDIPKSLGLSPIDKSVFSLICSFAAQVGEAFVCAREFSERLECRKETVCRSVKKLAEKGLIEKTGKKYLNFYPRVRILPCRWNTINESASIDAPMIKRSSIDDHPVIALCANDQTELKTTKKIKNESEKTVSSLLQKFGIGKNQTKALDRRFPKERILKQIDHLNALLDQGCQIKNQAAWLIRAIERDFSPSKNVENTQRVLDEDKQEESRRRAQILTQDAKDFHRREKPDEARRLAEKSLKIHPSDEARELIDLIEQEAKKRAEKAAARAQISDEEFDVILAEEVEAKEKTFRKFNWPQNSELIKTAAIDAAMDRVLKSYQRLSPLQ